MGKPEMSFKCGACEAAIFENDINRNGQTVKIKKTVLQRRYKGQDGQWQSTSSLDVNDIPKAILALTKAYDYLISGVDTGEA